MTRISKRRRRKRRQHPTHPDAGLALPQFLVRGDAAGGFRAAQAAIGRDPATGREFLKMPLPQPQTVQRLADVLGGLWAGLRRSDPDELARWCGWPARMRRTSDSGTLLLNEAP